MRYLSLLPRDTRHTVWKTEANSFSTPFFFVSDARILQNKHRESNRGNRDERISSTVSRKGKTSSECCIALSKSLLQRFIAFTEDCLFTDVNRKRWNIINISVTARETWSSFAVVCSEKKRRRERKKKGNGWSQYFIQFYVPYLLLFFLIFFRSEFLFNNQITLVKNTYRANN